MTEDLAIEKYKTLGEKLSTPAVKISPEQEYWQGQADKLTLSEKKPMVVVNMRRGNYEVWNESVAIKCGAEYCYVTGDVDSGQTD